MKSLPLGGVWIEIFPPFVRSVLLLMSLPLGGVWIEISDLVQTARLLFRHFPWGECGLKFLVLFWGFKTSNVTSLGGSVDWNSYVLHTIFVVLCHFPWGECGLKSYRVPIWLFWMVSLPLGGVWIEISILVSIQNPPFVTSLGGSVDWNQGIRKFLLLTLCHFPWGECGLKFWLHPVLPDPHFGHFPWGECGLKLLNWQL